MGYAMNLRAMLTDRIPRLKLLTICIHEPMYFSFTGNWSIGFPGSHAIINFWTTPHEKYLGMDFSCITSDSVFAF